MLAAYHPLWFRRACGAHQRYWGREQPPAGARILGGHLCAAAAKAVAIRDAWIGSWSDQQCRRGLHRIVANSRCLLLPDIAVPHLASHALALTIRRLPGDWRARYGFAPEVSTYCPPRYMSWGTSICSAA